MTSNLKVGDKVLYESLRCERMAIVAIERETPTQWITSDGGKFRKATLREVGTDGWTRSWIEPLTEKSYARYKAWRNERMIYMVWHQIKHLPRPTIPLERLKEIYRELKGEEVAK